MTADPVASFRWLRESRRLIGVVFAWGHWGCLLVIGGCLLWRDDALSKSVCHESVLKVSLVGTLTACVDPCQMVYGCGCLAAHSEWRSRSFKQRASREQSTVSWGSVFRRADFSTPTRGFSQSDCPCRAEPRPTQLLSVHTLSAYLFCHMKKIS